MKSGKIYASLSKFCSYADKQTKHCVVMLIELVTASVDVLNADSGLLQRSAPTTSASLPYMP